MPIFTEHCVECHGSPKRKSGLDLRSLEGVLRGGDDGEVIVPGDPEVSALYEMVLPGADTDMPPKDKQLSTHEIQMLYQWIQTLNTDPSESGWDAQASSPNPEGIISTATDRFSSNPWIPPAGTSPDLAIDILMDAAWQSREIEPAPLCDDATFARRAYLDIAGRIPTQSEARGFLKSTRPDKRERLIDQLLDSPDYAYHFRDLFDSALMGIPSYEFANKVAGDIPGLPKEEQIGAPGMTPERWLDRQRERQGWLDYLHNAFTQNRPWDEVVHELLLARPEDEARRGATWFLFERADDHEAVTDAVSSSLFGVQVQCAQCHDHPLAPEILQGHYWGLNAVFSRSENQMTALGPALGESAAGKLVSYTNVEGEAFDATLNFLGGASIPQKRIKLEDATDNDYLVPPANKNETPDRASLPKYSQRQVGVDAITENNPLIARAFVNRVWALLLGRGFVHPVDQMDSVHPPSHPELLDWLAQDFASNGYDIKRLVRAIARSRVYQLDGNPDSQSNDPSNFAFAQEKPLSAQAYYHSLFVAANNEAPETSSRPPVELRRIFPSPFSETHTSTLAEAMFLSNNSMMEEILADANNPKPGVLSNPESSKSLIRQTFGRVFGRDPKRNEIKRVMNYLSSRSDRPRQAYRQLLWAMTTSAEFRANH